MDRISEVPSGAHWGAFQAQVRDGELVATRPLADDPAPTPLIGAVAAAVNHPCRVTRPMVREGWLSDRRRAGRGAEPFVPVSWAQALDLVAGEIARVRDRHGNAAIFAGGGWASAGRFHAAKTLLGRLFNPLGGFTAQTTNWSFGAAGVVIPHVVGTLAPVIGPLTTWDVIRDHTRLFVAFGGVPAKNTQVNEGGTIRHRTAGSMAALARAGVEIIYLSPLRGDAPVPGATWIPLRPGSDAAAMLALCHTLVTEGLHDQAFIARHTTGFERFRPYLMGERDGQPKDADWAAALTGVPAETLRALARRMAATRTMVSMSWAVQRADHGEQPCWLTVVLAALLGQIGLPGGGFGIGYGAIDGLGQPRLAIPTPALPAPPNPVKTPVPVARITDMLLHPGESFAFNGRTFTYPDVKLMYWAGGNPFHHNPDLNLMVRAWGRPDTIVVHEPWWTPAAKHADIVLPVSTPLERNDIGASFWDNAVFAMRQAIAPRGEARSDFAILRDLAERLGTRAAFDEGRDEMDWLRHLYDDARGKARAAGADLPDFDTFWAAGRVELPAPAQPHVLFADFRADPDAHPLKTPSGRIEIFSATIAGFGLAEQPGHPVWHPPVEWLGAETAATHPLHLLSNQPASRLHSQLDMAPPAQAGKIRGREPLTMHPADAAARGLRAGDIVRVFNGRGACLAGLRLDDGMHPGVVQIATGAWYDPAEPGRAGTLDIHGNPNVLTRNGGTSPLAQGGVQQSTLVEVEAWRGPLPPLKAHEAPPIAPPT